MNWEQIVFTGAIIFVLLVLWMNRYRYEHTHNGEFLVRIDRVTGQTWRYTSDDWRPTDVPKKSRRTSSSAKDDPPEDLDAEKILMEVRLARRAAKIDSLQSVIDSLQNDGPQMKTRRLSPFEAARSILAKTRAEKLQQKIDSLQSVLADLNSER